MKRRSTLLVNIALILIFCTLFTKSEARNGSVYWDAKHHEELVVKDVGYDFLHGYRTALKNGWRGVQEATRIDLTPKCQGEISRVVKNTGLLMQYVDAVGKPRSGYLRGNMLWLGSYSECRDISNAQYCTATLAISVKNSKIPQLKTLGATWGVCFPSGCTEQDVSSTLKLLLQEVESRTEHKIGLQAENVVCPPVKPSYTTGVKATIALCGVLLFFCLIGTTIDLLDDMFNVSLTPIGTSDSVMDGEAGITMSFKSTNDPNSPEVNGTNHVNTDEDVVLLKSSSPSVKFYYILISIKESFPGQFFCCFSLLHNTAKIFKTDVPPSAIQSINGMRVISITWVILGHSFSNFASIAVDNRKGVIKDSQLLSMMAILSGTYSVDTFFFLSGLLVAYTCFRKLQKNDGSFNWILFYVHRFWRLTPSYMFVILFSIHLKGFLTESPFWYSQFTDPICSKNWWTNLLYINNFYPTNSANMCIGWSWYLANDMQFFVITPFLILPLFKVGWRGLVLPLGLLLEASVITAFIFAHWNIDPLALMKIADFFGPGGNDQTSIKDYMNFVYFKPYCRIQVYLVGFLLGYIMFRYRNTKARIPNWIVTLVGWSAAAVLAMLLVYGPHKSILPGAEEWNAAEKVLFGTFQRFLWGVVLAWVTYACHYGAGGLVQKFLSAKFWIPLSRLTYNVYLIHLIILVLMFYGVEEPVHYDLYTASYYFLTNVMLSYGAAYVLCVVIEFPCANLEELALKYIRKFRKRGD